jgi:hypothetical protein
VQARWERGSDAATLVLGISAPPAAAAREGGSERTFPTAPSPTCADERRQEISLPISSGYLGCPSAYRVPHVPRPVEGKRRVEGRGVVSGLCGRASKREGGRKGPAADARI